MKIHYLLMGVAASLALIIGASPVFARGEGKRMMKCEEHFKAMDTNKDGKVSLKEFMAYKHPRGNAEKNFKEMDANKDGFLSMEEFCREKGMHHKGM